MSIFPPSSEDVFSATGGSCIPRNTAISCSAAFKSSSASSSLKYMKVRKFVAMDTGTQKVFKTMVPVWSGVFTGVRSERYRDIAKYLDMQQGFVLFLTTFSTVVASADVGRVTERSTGAS